jgi:hypothetical protein
METAGGDLAAAIFGKDDLPVFAVLDGASAPGLVKSIYEYEPEYTCLYRGELSPDMAAMAPYLVRLESGSKFAEFVFQEGWGAHWGIFAASTANLRTLRDHFREFYKVELPTQRTVLFRYYDPRVLRIFLPACNAEELNVFFGPVETFIMEGDTADTAVKFSLAGNALTSKALPLKKPL